MSGGGGRKAVAGNPAREVSTTLCSVAAKIPWPLPARTAFRCHHKFGLTRELGTKANLFYRPRKQRGKETREAAEKRLLA